VTNPDQDFRALYDAHFTFVWRCLRRLGVREPDVFDQTQKVFMTAYFKQAEFEGRSLVTTWLFGFCERVASDYRRSALIRREIATDAAELDAYAASRDEIGAATELRQRRRLVNAILEKLPEAQRVVFVMFELEELSGQEIAKLLDISVGTVRSRLRLGREAFRREVRRLSAIDRKEAV